MFTNEKDGRCLFCGVPAERHPLSKHDATVCRGCAIRTLPEIAVQALLAEAPDGCLMSYCGNAMAAMQMAFWREAANLFHHDLEIDDLAEEDVVDEEGGQVGGAALADADLN